MIRGLAVLNGEDGLNALVAEGIEAIVFRTLSDSDMQEGVIIDLLFAGISSLILIFAIMLLITRSVVAALVIVGTVAASLGTVCGLSVLVWQDLMGFGVQWVVLPLSIIILLAVGSDYNLLVVSRLKEESTPA